MPRLTQIARIVDALPLAEGLDSEKDSEIDQLKSQAKSLFKRFASQPASRQAQRVSAESGKYVFHYILVQGVAFLTLTDKGYPKKLAFEYLDELAGEFGRLYGSQVEATQRPYAFIKFDTFIQKTKKLYMDTQTQRNLAKLNNDLSEVHSIMTRNIQEVLGQGEKLDNMAIKSGNLRDEAEKYKRKAKDLHTQALIRKYVPMIAIILIVLAVLYLRAKFYG